MERRTVMKREADILAEHGLPLEKMPFTRYREDYTRERSRGGEYVEEADRIDINTLQEEEELVYLEAHELAHKAQIDAVVGPPSGDVRDTLNQLESARQRALTMAEDYRVTHYSAFPREDLRKCDFETAALITFLGDDYEAIFAEPAQEYEGRYAQENAVRDAVKAAKQEYVAEIDSLLEPVTERYRTVKSVPRIEQEAGAQFWETYRRGKVRDDAYIETRKDSIQRVYQGGKRISGVYNNLIETVRNAEGPLEDRVTDAITNHVDRISSPMKAVQ